MNTDGQSGSLKFHKFYGGAMEKSIRIEELISLPDKVSLPIIHSQPTQVYRAIRKFCRRLERTEFQWDLLEVFSFHNKIGSWLDNGILSTRRLGLTKDDLMVFATKALKAATDRQFLDRSLKLKGVLRTRRKKTAPLLLNQQELEDLRFIQLALRNKACHLPPFCANPEHLSRHDLRIIERRLSITGPPPPQNKIC
jgi:hypothetical protein